MTYTILVVEDDAKIAAAIADHLARYGYAPVLVNDFRQVEAEFQRTAPQLVLMDVNLPYQDGFQLTRSIRRHSAVPILFLSARDGAMEQVLGLECGGDDYITKPFTLDVLLAKVRAVLRRVYGDYARGTDQGRTLVQRGPLVLDLTAAEMRVGEQAESLTRTEVKLLHLLLERADRVVSRPECLEALWDDSSFVDDNTLTVNVTRLRAKLESLGLRDVVETRRGLGYMLVTARLEESARGQKESRP